MSTLALEKLPESVDTLSALIHEGKTVHLTEGGRLVATVVPPAKQPVAGGRKRARATVIEVLEACRPHRRPRPERHFTAFLRTERDRE